MLQHFIPPKTALEAQAAALKLAFGPAVFQCVRIAWKTGLLASLEHSEGLTTESLAKLHNLSEYAISVLLETCLSAQVVALEDERYTLTKVGYFVLHDPMSKTNFDFMHDVCYSGLYELEECLRQEKPLGLKTLGEWPTLYEGLTHFPEPAKSSWYAFDHLYSDSVFSNILPLIFSSKPRHLMDIGANTGKWAYQCLNHAPDVCVTLVDLPQQLEVARSNIDAAGLGDRAQYAPMNILEEKSPFPGQQDVVWMSQFLSCFSMDHIRSIFRRARTALAKDGLIYVLDTFWDRQQHEISAYCLINSSPYFTAIASGNSKMYRSQDYIRCADDEGLSLIDIRDGLGICHSLLTFKARMP
jgi:ubiquinone/menaquinone biosynthesis C-methylase UbiE